MQRGPCSFRSSLSFLSFRFLCLLLLVRVQALPALARLPECVEHAALHRGVTAHSVGTWWLHCLLSDFCAVCAWSVSLSFALLMQIYYALCILCDVECMRAVNVPLETRSCMRKMQKFSNLAPIRFSLQKLIKMQSRFAVPALLDMCISSMADKRRNSIGIAKSFPLPDFLANQRTSSHPTLRAGVLYVAKHNLRRKHAGFEPGRAKSKKRRKSCVMAKARRLRDVSCEPHCTKIWKRTARRRSGGRRTQRSQMTWLHPQF